MRIKLKDIRVVIILVFIFVNNVGLPFGLQWTTLLTPIIFFSTVAGYKKTYAIGLGIYLLFFVLHYLTGIVSYTDYFRSSALHMAIFILAIAFHKIIKKAPETLFNAFDKAVYLNFYLTVIAVFLLLDGIVVMWTSSTSIGALSSTLRLRMFTYEPSYYSLMLTPIFFYKYFSFFSDRSFKRFIPIGILSISLLLSLSMGVILLLVFVTVFASLITANKNRTLFIIGSIFFSLVCTLVYLFNPSATLFARIVQFLNGNDTSGNARIFDPWIIAFRIVSKHKSFFTGVGWGHIQIVGHDIIQNFYGYSDSTVVGYDLPNICCEIFAVLGLFGLVLFIGIQIYFYYKTNVKRSVYRKYIFWFIFIYQFTGSYSSSLLHYALIIIAFSPGVDTYLNQLSASIINKKKKREYYSKRITMG